MKYKHIFIKVFIVGTLLVIIQTMLQNMNGFLSVINGLTKYLRPFIYAMFIAVLLNPMVEFAEKKLKFKRGMAIAMSLVALILFLTGTLLWFIPNLIDSFEEIIEKFPAFQENFNKYLEQIFAFLREKNLLLMDGEEIKQAIQDFFVKNMNNIKALLISLGLNVIDWIVEIFIILLGGFLALYFIYNREYFMQYIKNMIFIFYGDKEADEGLDFLIECKNIFLNYMAGRIIISVIVGLIAFAVMKIASVPYALLNAVMIGVGNMIPYFGSIAAGIIAFILVLLSNPIKCFYLLLAIIIAQNVDGYIIGPKILGKSVGISSFWIIASVIIMGNIMGTLGMFLGVPIFAIIKLIYIRILKNKRNGVHFLCTDKENEPKENRPAGEK